MIRLNALDRLVGVSLPWMLLTGPAASQEVLLRIEGDSINEQIGRADDFGDLNGDGVTDIVSLEEMERVVIRSGADGSILDSMPDNVDYRGSLTLVSGIGDFDGDGTPDVMVGAGGYDVIDSVGRVDILSGATHAMIATFIGTIVDGYLGCSVADVGDVDGDGYADALFIGFRGPAELRFGPDGSRFRSHPSFGFGVSVAAVGDVNADGYPDYAVGSPIHIETGLANAGRLDVYSGSDGTLLRQIIGNRFSGHLGAAAAPAGDLDGDGVGDVLVGLPGNYTIIGAGHGIARVYSIATGAVLWEYKAPTVFSDNFGIGMTGGKDYTGDGVLDWVIGATSATDPAGDVPGAFYFFDGASGSLIWKRYGLEGFIGRMGQHVFLMDDLTGDGIAEIGYGDLSADSGGVSTSGVLTVIAGAPGSAIPFCTTHPNSTGRRAKIRHEGPIGIENNELILMVDQAVPNAFGLFYYGPEPRQFPFGDGVRCVGGRRMQRLYPPIAVDGVGHAERVMDFTAPPASPSGATPITPGSTHYFQFWFRDTNGPGGTGFNLSDGLEILFAP